MIVGVSGHQDLGDAETVLWIRAALVHAVGTLSPKLGLTCLAVGSDQLFAAVLSEMGIPFDAIIPCHEYESTFDDTTVLRYRELIARAQSQVTLPFPSPSEEAFWSAGRQVVDRSKVLVAIWDGEGARGLGGTGDVVAYAVESGHLVVHINPRRRTTTGLLPI